MWTTGPTKKIWWKNYYTGRTETVWTVILATKMWMSWWMTVAVGVLRIGSCWTVLVWSFAISTFQFTIPTLLLCRLCLITSMCWLIVSTYVLPSQLHRKIRWLVFMNESFQLSHKDLWRSLFVLNSHLSSLCHFAISLFSLTYSNHSWISCCHVMQGFLVSKYTMW